MPGATLHLIADTVGYLPGAYRAHPSPIPPWLTVPDGGPPSGLDITLEPGGTWLRGRVVDPDGRPVANASIALTSDADQPRWELSIPATTDANGRYEAWGEPGASAGATTDGWALFRQRRSETEDGTLVTLLPEAVIRGRVLTERGAGAPGARVGLHDIFYINGNPYYAIHTDMLGNFEIRGLAADKYRVTAFTGESAAISEEIELRAGEVSSTLTIHLKGPIAPLRGQVVDADTGEAVPFCRIGLVPADGDRHLPWIFELDGLGRLDITAAPILHSVDFLVCPGWAGRPPYPPFMVGDGPAPRWEVDRGSTLRGRLITANGDPIAGRRIRFEHQSHEVDRFLSSGWIYSETDGAFEFRGVRPGRYRVRAGLNGTHRKLEVEVVDGAPPTTLRLPPMGDLEVRVPGNDDFLGLDVYTCPPPAYDWESERRPHRPETSTVPLSGLAKFKEVAPGRYRVSRSGTGKCGDDPGEVEVVVVADETTTVTLPERRAGPRGGDASE
ncbi:MAG: carboxypeptidase regulatory-like domain-containing protein [Nannocystaceae bacterium]